MWIFCCGIKGTGVDSVFNLVGELVEQCQTGKRIEWDAVTDFSVVRQKYDDYTGFKVVKTHRLPTEVELEFLDGNAMGFYSYRDVRDVLISASEETDKQLDGLIKDEEYVSKYIGHFFAWQKIPDIHKLAYEDYVFDVGLVIRRIQKVLGIESLSAEAVSDISQKHTVSPEHNGQWSTVLSPKQNETIERSAGEWLFNNGYELKTNVQGLKLFSYSQHGDDDYIWKYFDKKKTGLIVEVGAFDGIHFSNSYSLENIGWKALCMEPTPSTYKKLITNRPKAKCYNLAVVGDEDISEIDFLSEELGLLSGVNIDVEDVKLRYKRRGLKFKAPKKIKVNAKTLNSIFSELKIGVGEIDCITIDVEGFEMDVLRGFDLGRFKPQLVIIEANTLEHEKEIVDYLEVNSYALATKLGVNLMFLPESEQSKEVVVDCIPMVQHHPLGKKFTIQASKTGQAAGLSPSIVTRILRKVKSLLSS